MGKQGRRQMAGALVTVLLPVSVLIAWLHTTTWPGGPRAHMEGTCTQSAVWPSETAAWQSIELPRRHCDVGASPRFDHYRMTFPRSDGPLAMFVPEFRGSLRVAVNGIELQTIGSLAQPAHDLHFQPTYLLLPEGTLTAGSNELQLTVTNAPGRYHRIKPFYLGDRDALASYSAPLIWLVDDVGVLVMSVALVAGLFAVLLYALADRARLYLWFAGFCACSALREVFFLMSAPELEALRVALYFTGTNFQLACMIGLVSAIETADQRWHRWLLIGTGVWTLCVLSVIAVSPYMGGQLANFTTAGIALLTGIVVVTGFARLVKRRRTALIIWVAALTTGSFMMTLSDAAPIVLFARSTLYPLAHLAPVLLVLAFWLLVVGEFQRTAKALAGADAASRRALAEQRQGIRRDLHDGVGGQMASLVLLARRQSPELAHYLEQSLEDLRATMDRLDDDLDEEFDVVLTNLRTKLDRFLAGHGLTSSWQVTIRNGCRPDRASRRTLHFALQELIHNTIRHAPEAEHVQFTVVHDRNALLVRVQDNGRGFNLTGSPAGSGLTGLRERLERLGGWLSIDTSSGVNVSFSLPLQAGAT